MFRIIKRSNREEWANTITHAIGIILSYLGLMALIFKAFRAGSLLHFSAASVYGFSMVFLFTASTIYHVTGKCKWKTWFQKIDHIAIYFLIAGTYTPICVLLLKDRGGVPLFYIVWIVSVIGVIYKLLFINKFKMLSIIFYLLLGWSVLLKIDVFINDLPIEVLAWLLTGGFFYTLGVVFFIKEKMRYSHAIWHLFVLAGCWSHYYLIYRYVLN